MSEHGEHDASTEPRPPSLRRPRWRFTIREWMLALIAICAILTNFRWAPAYQRTKLFDATEPTPMMTDVYKRLGLKLSFSGGSGSSTGGRKSARDFAYELNVDPKVPPGQIVYEMRRWIMERIKSESLTVHGRGLSGDPKNGRLKDFHLDYSSTSASGSLRVYSMTGAGPTWRLLVLVEEASKR